MKSKPSEKKEISSNARNMARFEALFHAITDLVFMADSNFNIQLVNRRLGSEGKKCYEAFGGFTAPCKECLVDEVKITRKPAKAERRIDNRIYQAIFYPILNDEGELTDVIEVAREITNEKEIEQQLIQSDRLISLGSLVSGIAHEINNPNTFIRGNLSIIGEAMAEILPILDDHAEQNSGFKVARLPYPFFKDKIQLLIKDMQNGADKIMNIVNDLRKFARREEGLLDEDVDINGVIKSSLRLVHNQTKHLAKIHLELDDNLPVTKGNIQKLEQVIVNIILNASQAIAAKNDSKPGNITIKTLVDRCQCIGLQIADDGIGMTDEIKDRVFDPFYTTKRAKQGTGLGLSIAYGFIEEHAGSISVESQAEKGSEFKIVLPVVTSDDKPQDKAKR